MQKKTNQNFRLPKTIKRMMASMVNAEARNGFKWAMINAIVDGNVVHEKEKKK